MTAGYATNCCIKINTTGLTLIQANLHFIIQTLNCTLKYLYSYEWKSNKNNVKNDETVTDKWK